MKETKLISNNVTNVFILIVTIVSLFISFLITSNNYRDNKHYSQAYFLMNKHNLSIHSKGLSNNDIYYLIDSPKNTDCNESGHIKYYLLDKKEYTINEYDSVLNDKQYNLLSCQKLPKYNLGIIKKEKAYYIQEDRTFTEFLQTYKTSIGGIEPIYILLSYIASSILEYNYFILLMNLIFLLVVFLALKKFTKNYISMYILLVSFDFYFFIYMSNTHRLKLAIIFFLLSYLAYNKTKIMMMISAILSHLQILLFYLYYLILTLIHSPKLDDILLKKKKYSIYILLAFILGFIFREQIITKINWYLHIEIPYKVGTLILIYLLYLFIFKLRSTIKVFVPLAIMIMIISFFIGSGRVNFMLMEFIFIVELNRLLNRNTYALFAVIPFILYSFYKSAHYVQLGIQ